MSDQECAWLAGILYSAGHETTTTTMCWFILSMVLYPKYQIEAQKELDKVVGYARLPSLSDLPHLPYIQAILKEVLRWRPAAPLAAPHVSTEDDFYDGYFIPKGSMVIPNVWTMNRDPKIYGSDGDQFNPERHLDDNKMLKSDINEGHFTYGFGQRVCVGRHVANNSLFIQIAIILWAMSLEPAKDSSGNPIRPNVHAEEQNGIFIRPAPFDITARARFSEAEALIQQTREDIMKEVNSQFELTRDT
ncbi:hypothetical protein VKT23_006381 [Stygiomarasmius scandens]|uniref:Cytochrome P450 n=1 Tax=Marasmiellus scandens TaxID=2682957 RepID=A0ABR1JMP0_9AGAR